MNRLLFLTLAFLSTCSPIFGQNSNKDAGSVNAYIKTLNLNSISKADLLKIDSISLDSRERRLIKFEVYFHGKSIPNVLMLEVYGNKLFLLRNTIEKLEPPFQLVFSSLVLNNYDSPRKLAKDFIINVF